MTHKGYGDRIARRHAQVVGDAPRIAPQDDSEMSRESREIVDAVRAAAGSGPAAVVPAYTRTLTKHPRLFRAQLDIGTMFYTGDLPPRERELAVLRVGWLAGAPYEWGEHVKIAKRVGITGEEIERATVGSAAPGWNSHEWAIVRAVEELITDFVISDETWSILAQSWNEAQLLEFPAMVGQYVALAYLQNSIRTGLDSDNPGLDRR